MKVAVVIFLSISFSFLCLYFLSESISIHSLLCSISENISRKSVFLFCNAILFFLARDFLALSSSSSSPGFKQSEKHAVPQTQQTSFKNNSVLVIAESDQKEDVQENDDGVDSAVEKKMEIASASASAAADDDDYEMGEESTEELNKKFEEFIKKMREELRSSSNI